MHTTPRLALPLAALAAIALFAACGGHDDDPEDSAGFASVPPGVAAGACDHTVVNEPIKDNLLPLLLSSDLAVGENRVTIGLYDQEQSQAIANADVHLAFVCYDNEDPETAFEADPEAITLTKSYTHTHDDGTVETHSAGESGSYASYVEFDRPGTWGVDVSGKTEDGTEFGPTRLTFSVNEENAVVAVGDPAPLTKQPLLADVADIREIDTSENPVAEQHNLTIADAVASGKPTVIAFATPAFCQSQVCGPVKEIFDELYGAYKNQANFIHVEPYDLERMRTGGCGSLAACLVPAVNEWKLPGEPWVFIVGKDGTVAARFEGIASAEEIKTALQAALDA
jgi:hypothetical protein